MRFSEIFSIGLGQPQLDFVDIKPDCDTPLFIDPFAISLRGDAWSEICHQHITHFFQTALDHIRAGRDQQARQMLNGLSEPNATCLGLSRGLPAGRGVGGRQALDLYESLAASQAAKNGLLEELAECDLFVPGIARDKISDITTNIIRRPLIEYTQQQCALHGIILKGDFPSGHFWDMEAGAWREEYVRIPVVNHKKLILVPKYSVRRSMALQSQEFYSQHILNFIQEEQFARGSPLVRVLASGERRPPTKKTLKEHFLFSKEFVASFSEAHPDVLKAYKRFYAEIEGAGGPLRHQDFDDGFDEAVFSKALAAALPNIPSGNADAGKYHTFIMGALEFIFWPNLIYPIKEHEVHEGRKRIDITYTNAAKDGFFFRAHTDYDIASRLIMVECKNYSKDPANPEFDQLAGRFGVNRGKLGMLLYRMVEDYDRLCTRCRDTAQDGRGFMIALGDQQVIEFLNLIADGQRKAIDARLQAIFNRLIS
ncbi:MAG: hypothetical protein GVY13_09600 [Alphaproteobacteria bacterium]|jgi:hypothetical protein|nr:hypothetical protein [Alphaproteobacteria bacterium]